VRWLLIAEALTDEAIRDEEKRGTAGKTREEKGIFFVGSR
jgi:hypothetical protein